MKTPMVPFSSSFGDYLKRKRIEQGLTQTDISNHLGYTSPQMVSKWERGLCGPKFADLVKLQSFLKIDKKELMIELLNEQEKIFRCFLK